MKVIGVIPARWGSTRFPGKILHPIAGRPLLQWVVGRAQGARRLSGLLVATDDERIRAAAESFGVKAVMTSSAHPTGTDRIAEAVAGVDAGAVINIQGDEPLIDPALIDRLAEVIASADGWDMATAATPIRDPAQLGNPNVVKVATATSGCALYFSRSPIPFDRDGIGIREPGAVHVRHIGIYAYRRAFLERLVREPPCRLERLEKLEQLRALDLGARIRVLEVADYGIGVDVPGDVPAAEAALRAAGLAG